ncbi:uncharacterized protein LOC119090486 [Pollicipes pollicipes]|uniref:uncharacterized protein LOC119090486 n=1 Tax=Pollicipes pollicipes TaxID=41117 RepID=UPI00188586B4|nr:uncharacterized protein LOC119090486 [Pollicipes pollicipes]
MDGDLPTSQEQRKLEELRLLYTLAFLHPTFDFIERQHYRDMCGRLSELESELQKLERRQEQKPLESVVPKLCCDGGSHRDNPAKTCSLCFSTSSSEHICKLRLLRRNRPNGGDFENQVNVQWSTGNYSNLAIRDKQLRQLHTKLEGIISQPRLPAFPRDPDSSGQLNGYLQHLQGLSAVTWPRSQSVFEFFRQLADEQEQRAGPAGAARPHSVYTPRLQPPHSGSEPTANGLPSSAESHKLTIPAQNGTAEADDSETSPAVLDDDTELKSYTIYNSSITNGRAGEPTTGAGRSGARTGPCRLVVRNAEDSLSGNGKHGVRAQYPL